MSLPRGPLSSRPIASADTYTGVAATPTQVCSFASAAPQQADLSISGWARGANLLAQGLVPALIFAAAQNPTQVQAKVFPSVATTVVTAAAKPAFVASTPQLYLGNDTTVFDTVLSGNTPRIPNVIYNTKQAEQTQYSSVFKSVFTPPVTASVLGSFVYNNTQIDVTQYSSVFKSVVATTTTSGILGSFVNASPENIDLSISGWARGSNLLAQGDVPKSIWGAGQDPYQVQSTIWRSVDTSATPTTGDIPRYIWSAGQDPYQIQSIVWQSVVTPPTAATGNVPRSILSVEQYKYQPVPSIQQSVASPQGVSSNAAYIWGNSAALVQQAEALKSFVQKSVFTPPAATTGNLGVFASTLPQYEDRVTRAVYKPLIGTAPISGYLGSFYTTLPQVIVEERVTRTVWQSAASPQGVSSSSTYIWGGSALSIWQAETYKIKLWTIPNANVGVLGTFAKAAPQVVDLTQQAAITPVAITQPILGATVSPVPPIPPQFDISNNSTVVWTPSTYSPGIPPPEPEVKKGGKLKHIKDINVRAKSIYTTSAIRNVTVSVIGQLITDSRQPIVTVPSESVTIYPLPIICKATINIVHVLRLTSINVGSTTKPVVNKISDAIISVDTAVPGFSGIDSGMKLGKVKVVVSANPSVRPIVGVGRLKRPDVSNDGA